MSMFTGRDADNLRQLAEWLRDQDADRTIVVDLERIADGVDEIRAREDNQMIDALADKWRAFP